MPAAGTRMFWFDQADGRALFVDKRREICTADTREGRREIVVDPDILADFKELALPGFNVLTRIL